jgi:hypothetical protein
MMLRDLQVELCEISTLRPRRGNPRTHSKKQLRQIADSIRTFGFTNPVLLDDAGGVIAGHGRIEAAKLLDMAEVPTIRLKDMTEAEIRAYVIADNRLAENAGWDRELLAIELQYLCELDLDFDVTITGFAMPEIDVLFGELQAAASDDSEHDPADEVPEVDNSGPAVTRPGDLWLVGKHRLICGDATDPTSYVSLLGGERAQMVFTDPPYNVPIDGHVCGLGSVKHREFAMASGEMSKDEFAGFLKTAFGNLAAHAADGAIHYICMDWRHITEVLAAAEGVFTELKNLCVWAKTNGGMGALYRSQHELVFVFKSGTRRVRRAHAHGARVRRRRRATQGRGSVAGRGPRRRLPDAPGLPARHGRTRGPSRDRRRHDPGASARARPRHGGPRPLPVPMPLRRAMHRA